MGTVTDPTGAVVPGATVTVTSTSTGTSRTIKTTESGTYSAIALLPGTLTRREVSLPLHCEASSVGPYDANRERASG